MLPRNRNSRFHRRMVSKGPKFGGLTMSFYSLTLFMLIAGGQVSVSHSAPIPPRHANNYFIPKNVQTSTTFTAFEEKLREAAAANSQKETDMKPLTVLKRMFADLAHAKNELVLTLLVLAVVLYTVVLGLMASIQYKDKGKSKKQKLQHFGHKGIFKPYLIKLGTGILPGSGCQVDVLMKLKGTSGNTPYYNLSRMSRESGRLNPCRRGGQAAFVIWTRNIGDLTDVQFELCNGHIRKNPTWLLDFIRVTDCQDETQRTWLVNQKLTGAGPHIFDIQSSRLQATFRYLAVNLLKGFSRFSLWNAWTLMKVDASLGPISSLCLCLLFTLSQMGLSSILLYQLPTSANSDTRQQTPDSYGLNLSYKDTLVLLAGGTVTITACIWVIETLLRFVPRNSSGLTRSQYRHIKKAIKRSKYEEDEFHGKFDAVEKTMVKKQRDGLTPTPALVVQDRKNKTLPSDEPSTSVADKDTNDKVKSTVNSSGSIGSRELVGGEMQSANNPGKEYNAKNAPAQNQGPIFANMQKDVPTCNNSPSSSSTCREKEDPTQDTKKNQLVAQQEQVLNANVEELKDVEQMKDKKAEEAKDMKISQNELTTKKPVKMSALTGKEKELLPKEKVQGEQVTQEVNILAKQCSQTENEQQKGMPAARETAQDLKDLAVREKEDPPQHEEVSDMKDDSFPKNQHVKKREDRDDDSSLSDAEKMLANVSVKTLLENVCQRIKNSLIEAQVVKQSNGSNFLDVKTLACMVVKVALDACLLIYQKQSCDDSKTNMITVGNLKKKVSNDILASLVVCKETPGNLADTEISLDACKSNRDTLEMIEMTCSVTDSSSVQSKIPLESVAPDSLKVALKESVAECVAILSSPLAVLPDKTEQYNDLKLAEETAVDATHPLSKREQDCTPSGKEKEMSCDVNGGTKTGTGRPSDKVGRDDTSSTVDKQASEDKPLIQYVNEVQPHVRNKKRKSVIYKMGKALKGMRKHDPKPKESGISIDSTSSHQSSVVNMEPTTDEKETHTNPSDQLPCTLTYEKEKTPMKKVWHRLRKKRSTSFLQNEDKTACLCPSETKATDNENNDKNIVDQDKDGVAAKSCEEVQPFGSGTDVRKPEEKCQAWFPKEQPVAFPSAEQEEERPMASEEPQSVRQILQRQPQPEKSFTSILKQQTNQHLPDETNQTGGSSLDGDLPADRTMTEDEKPTEAQQGTRLSAVDHFIGQKEDASAQHADRPTLDKVQQRDGPPAVKDQPVDKSAHPLHPTDTKPDVNHQDGRHISEDQQSSQHKSDETGGDTESKDVHKCDNAPFSQHTLDKIKRKIIRKMLFHVGKVVNECPSFSQHSVMNKVLVALDDASFSSSVYANILERVDLEVQSLKDSWKSSCSCGLMYQIGCRVLRRNVHMKEAIGLDEVPLEKEVLETALDAACHQEAGDVLEMVIQNSGRRNTLAANVKQLIPGVDSENSVADWTRKHRASVFATIGMAGKLLKKKHGVESPSSRETTTEHPFCSKPSSVSSKAMEAKLAVASSSMDDAAIIPITPHPSDTSNEKIKREMEEKQKLEAWRTACKRSKMIRHKSRTRRHGRKKPSNKNKNCSADEPAPDASKDLIFLEMVMEEEEKPDGKLNIGDILLDQDYADHALLTIEAELAGTTHIPAFLGYAIYALLILLCALAAGVTVLFGAALNHHYALVWLICTAVGLACHIVVLEPIKVLLIVFFSSVRRQYIM